MIRGLCRGYIGIVEIKMETTVSGLGLRAITLVIIRTVVVITGHVVSHGLPSVECASLLKTPSSMNLEDTKKELAQLRPQKRGESPGFRV